MTEEPPKKPASKSRAQRRADAKWKRRKHKHRYMTRAEAIAMLRFDKIVELKISDEMIKVEDLTESDAAMVIWELYKIEVHWEQESGLVDQSGKPIKSVKTRNLPSNEGGKSEVPKEKANVRHLRPPGG